MFNIGVILRNMGHFKEAPTRTICSASSCISIAPSPGTKGQQHQLAQPFLQLRLWSHPSPPPPAAGHQVLACSHQDLAPITPHSDSPGEAKGDGHQPCLAYQGHSQYAQGQGTSSLLISLALPPPCWPSPPISLLISQHLRWQPSCCKPLVAFITCMHGICMSPACHPPSLNHLPSNQLPAAHHPASPHHDAYPWPSLKWGKS